MPSARSSQAVALFRHLSRRRRRQLAGLLVFMVVGALAELVSIGSIFPFLRIFLSPDAILKDARLAPLFAAAGWSSAADLVLPAVILLIGSAIVAAIVRLALNWACLKFIHGVGHDLSVQVFRHTLDQPYEQYTRTNSSEVVAAFEKINNTTIFLLLPVMNGCAAVTISLLIVGLLFAIDVRLTSIATLSIGVMYLGLSLGSRRRFRDISERWTLLSTARVKAVQEAIGGFRDIVLDRLQPFFIRQFAQVDREYRQIAVVGGVLAGMPRYVVEALGIVLIGVLALVLSARPGGIVAATPTLATLAVGAQRLMPLLQLIYIGWAAYQTTRGAVGDVLALLNRQVLDSTPPVAGTTPFANSLELRDVSFRYAGHEPSLAGLNLSIGKGERIGVVGKTGSGKSTLVDLMMGLLPPTTGAILIDGATLTPAGAATWQQQIAHVPQAIFLADATFAENIAFGEEPGRIDETRVREAAARADLDGFIASLPAGYRTEVGERGIRLSGGQRQRIGIARALYKRASILILDEATSALDGATEAAIMESITRLDRALTIIMIAHRISTLRTCDRIVELTAGGGARGVDYAALVASA